MISFKTTNSFWLKSKIYLKKVPVITNNTLAPISSFVNIIFFSDKFILYINIHLKNNICCHHEKQIYVLALVLEVNYNLN